jgi:hypothetical protein
VEGWASSDADGGADADAEIDFDKIWKDVFMIWFSI